MTKCINFTLYVTCLELKNIIQIHKTWDHKSILKSFTYDILIFFQLNII